MPVLSIVELNDLIVAGKLDGRVAAVRGYWESSIIPSCPAPDHWTAPLEDYCQFDVFSDVPYQSADCQSDSSGNTVGCDGKGPPPEAETLKPRLLDNYENHLRVHPDHPGHYFDPWPVVLVGHADDPRSLQCATDVQRECQLAFVVDTVAWANGQTLDLALQGDPYSPKPRMSIDQVAAAVGGVSLISVTLLTADEVSGVEPRINVVGDNLIWVVRGLRDQEGTEETGAANVWVVDDRDGSVIGTTPLELAPAYQPGYFSAQATVRGYDPGGNGPYPFFSVDAAGVAVHQAMMGGWMVSGGGSSEARWYPGAPLLLDPGDYVLSAWRSTIDHPSDVVGSPTDACSTSLTLTADERTTLEAAFPKDGACTWRAPTFDDTPFN